MKTLQIMKTWQTYDSVKKNFSHASYSHFYLSDEMISLYVYSLWCPLVLLSSCLSDSLVFKTWEQLKMCSVLFWMYHFIIFSDNSFSGSLFVYQAKNMQALTRNSSSPSKPVFSSEDAQPGSIISNSPYVVSASLSSVSLNEDSNFSFLPRPRSRLRTRLATSAYESTSQVFNSNAMLKTAEVKMI